MGKTTYRNAGRRDKRISRKFKKEKLFATMQACVRYYGSLYNATTFVADTTNFGDSDKTKFARPSTF